MLSLHSLNQVFSSSMTAVPLDVDDPEHPKQRRIDYRAQLTRHCLLAVTSCSASLVVQFVLILHFIFSVYSVRYRHRRRVLEAVHLVDAAITGLCIVMMVHSATTYRAVCGCMDSLCRRCCTVLVDPSISAAPSHFEPVLAATTTQKIEAQRVSVTLQSPNSDLDQLHRHHAANGDIDGAANGHDAEHRYWSQFESIDLESECRPFLTVN